MLKTRNNISEKIKRLIRHELLNILTLINVLISSDELDEAKKEQILDLIKLASLLITYENVFLGKKPKFFIQKVNLKEILEIIVIIYKKKIADNNINVILPKYNFFVKTDGSCIKETLEQIIKKLVNSVTGMEFKFDDQAKKLTILFKGGSVPKFNKKNLIQSLGKESLLNNEIALQLALEILDLNKIKFTSTRNRIVMTFPC